MGARFWLLAGALTGLAAIAMPVLNPDLYWHLSAGKYIAAHFSIPAADFLSWTEYGAPWTDFEWLVQLVYYGVNSLAGMPGLFILKMLLLGATFPAFYLFLRGRGLGRLAFIALPLWGAALMANSDLRPENFSVLFFALLLFRLEAARAASRDLTASPAGYAALALFFALWANLHAGFAYGLVLLALYALGNWAGGRLWPASGGRNLLPGIYALCSAAAGTLLNPWGWKLYSILLRHAADSSELSRYLAEWMPPSLSNPWHWPFIAFLSAALLALLLRFKRERSLPPAQLLALAWLGFEAARHTRHIVFLCMAAAVFMLDAAGRLWEPELLERRGRALFVICLAYFALLVWPKYASFGNSAGAEAAGAAAYLQERAAELGGRKLYNPWAWGGYLGWAAPAHKVFADGRYIFHKYLEPVSGAMADQDTWEEFAAGRGIGLALFRRDYVMLDYGQRYGGVVVKVKRPSYLLFMPEEKWALVYWDAFSVLFARRGGPVPGEFRLLRPEDQESLRLSLCSGEVKRGEVEAELERYQRTAGRRVSKEAELLRIWLGGFPSSCPALKRP